jgi:hypothetical protein
MRSSFHSISLIGFLAMAFLGPALFGQWAQVPAAPAASTQMSTGNFVAIGASTNAPPYADTSLRLGNPAGFPATPCSTYQPALYQCLQLAFGTAAGEWWGFKLDANNDLHLVRDSSNTGWNEGVTFAREGNVAINGGTIPLRMNAANSGGFGVELHSRWPSMENGMELAMAGNSAITVSGVQVGHVAGIPVIRSTDAALPLYLNLWQNTDVEVGGAGSHMGLLVKGDARSYFMGAVGIGGTPDPAYKLDVIGNAHFSGTVSGGNIQANYQDVAEWVPSATALAPATLVVLDPTRSNHVTPSLHAYDTSVAGVVSARPGITLGEAGTSKALIATTGRVLLRVDASHAPIAIGDLLVTSDKPGLAMKSIPIDLQGIAIHRPGTVVGKALEPLASGEGEILVLLSLQ